MTGRSKITCTYRIADDEALMFEVTIANSYPDAVAEAKTTVLSLLHDGLADVLDQTRPPLKPTD